jgi:dipeptidyl-peptidase-4
VRRLLPLIALIASQLIAGQEVLTVERILSEPPLEGVLPKEVRWLLRGESFSFLGPRGEGKDAHTALWLESAASGDRKCLLDEGELPTLGEGKGEVAPRLAGYRWSPNGDAVLLSGSGDLFLVVLPSRQVRRLTATAPEEEAAAFSPDGRWVSFVRDNDLFALELATGSEVRLTEDGSPDRLNGMLDWVYGEEVYERGASGYAWSPDSRSIAFITLDEKGVPRFPLVSLLEPHPTVKDQHYPCPGDPNPVAGLSVVRVVPDADASRPRHDLRFTGEDAAYLVRFGWTPDGRAVWYQLENRAQTRLALVRNELGSGRADTLLVEVDPAWIDLSDDLRFLGDSRLLWSSERSGFRHLYVYGTDGKAQQITSGPWEVRSVVAVDEDSGWVTFTATEASPLERQLYRVRLDGSGFARLTHETGSHAFERAPGTGLLLDTHSRLGRPPSMMVRDAGGKMLREVAPIRSWELEKYALGRTEFLKVPVAGGTILNAKLVRPPDFDPGRRYPVVVYVYGGPGSQTVLDAWGGRYELLAQVLATRGFLVFSLDGRGTPGRGREFARALLRRMGKVELEDQLAGVEWLKRQPFVDGQRIGIWGASYGGFMTCYALTNAPGVFRAGVGVASVTDWRLYDSIYTERYLKLPAENPDGYRDSSPVNQADRLSGALLLAHGTADDNVHWHNTLAFADALTRAGKSFDLALHAGATHRFYRKDQRVDLYARMVEYFERNLKP